MSATEHPVISVGLDHATADWVIYCTSYGQVTPAGARLFRAPPHPDIQFQHESREAAEKDAGKLREYIEKVWPAKPPSKKKLREAHD